jgi:sec-independent protein translocase protein TatA
MAILGALALMLFGPEQLPKVARKVGHVMRDVQNTSQQFVREMERAADDYEPPKPAPHYDYPEYTEPLSVDPQVPGPVPASVPAQPEPGHPAPLPKREQEYRVD